MTERSTGRMIVSLPMYDPPGLHAATDRLWAAVRAHLPDALQDAPTRLIRTDDPWAHWRDPDLLLSQTCGLPYRARLHGRVTLVATPVHGPTDVPVPDGHYRSLFVCAADDTRTLADLCATGTLAYNEALSQSGWAAPVAHLGQKGLTPGTTLHTGGHHASLHAVATGRADFACVDMISLHIAQSHSPGLMQALRVSDHTAPTPALPYITAQGRDPAPIARALAKGIATLTETDRRALCLQGVTQIPAQAYCALPIPTPPIP